MISKEQQAVEQVAKLYESFWNRHDMDAFAKLFAEDADFVDGAGEWWRGRKTIKEIHQAYHAGAYKNSRLTIQGNSVRLLGQNVAVLRSSWMLTGQTGPDGQILPPHHGILTHVLHEQEGTWMILATQNTNKIKA